MQRIQSSRRSLAPLFAGLVAASAAGCAGEAQRADSADPHPGQTQTTPPTYRFPDEAQPHEGTWLTWPHSQTYGADYASGIEDIWVQMVQALAPGEKVHIIAYDDALRVHITDLLEERGVDLAQVDFLLAASDDVWVRDTGPMFAYDEAGQLTIIDFDFDGWGKKTSYEHDDVIPQVVARERDFPIVKVSGCVLEGGSVELSPDGTLLATRSAVISGSRNPGMGQAEMEGYLRQYLGAMRFIWLDGVEGEDITDAHIDGFARFYDEKTLLTVPEDDFFDLYEGMKESDYDTLMAATNAAGDTYKIVEIPLTQENVTGLDYRGSYLNFYVANAAVLVPVYGDVHDEVAVSMIRDLYPDRHVVPIDVSALYAHGGMIHCVTQQQPA